MLIRTKITGIGDPFILKDGDTYYAYPTSAPDGFRYFTSKDLVEWSEGEYCYRGSSWGENNFWAPEVYLRGGKYYLLYTARWKKNHSLRIGLAVSDSPRGPFADLQDGPLFDAGYAAIDATLFTDDDGANYLYFSRDCSENVIGGVHTSEIYCARLSHDLSRLENEPFRVTTPELPFETELDAKWRWNEGPAVLKHDGKYYLNFSVNCFDSPAYCVGCAVAEHPEGPFVKYPAPVLSRREGDFSGPGHNAFFWDGERLLTAFHIHTDPAHPSGDRRMCIAEARFEKDGTFRILSE